MASWRSVTTRLIRLKLPQTEAQETESTSTATNVPPNTARAEWLKQHSALVRLITPMFATATPGLSRKLVQWGLIEPGQAADDVPADYVPVAYGVYRQPAAAEWEQSFALTEALLRELQREVTTAGATFAVVSTTAPEQVYPDRWQQQLEQNPTMQHYKLGHGTTQPGAAPNRQQAGCPLSRPFTDFSGPCPGVLNHHST